MRLTIGETIRNLRREKNLTQEELAEIFGVTYQSVSRWENGSCYPDIEFLPDIAEFFGISTDKLMGIDKGIEQKEVEQYLSRFQEAVSQGRVYDCITIAREGVAAYPNNYMLLNKLMYALFISGDDDGNISEWQENAVKYDEEITALGERIMKYCPDPDIRCEATARLAFNHALMQRKQRAREIYDALPSAEYCRENNIWWVLQDEEKEDFLRNKIKSDYETLKRSIWLLASGGGLSDADALAVYEKVFALDDLITDHNLIRNDWGSARLAYEMALRYANTDNIPQALVQLEACANSALAFDSRPASQVYNSTLLGEIQTTRLDFETSDTRPLCEIVREEWLANAAFDRIRKLKEFQAIQNRLFHP